MRVMGPIVIEISPYDFIDVVHKRGLTVIRRALPINGFYHYIAADIGITFYARSQKELTDIPVDFIAKKLGMREVIE